MTREQASAIEAEIQRAAEDHLQARDASTAMSYYTDDVIAVSNNKLFPSYKRLAEDVRSYYEILKRVDYA